MYCTNCGRIIDDGEIVFDIADATYCADCVTVRDTAVNPGYTVEVDYGDDDDFDVDFYVDDYDDDDDDDADYGDGYEADDTEFLYVIVDGLLYRSRAKDTATEDDGKGEKI